MSIASAVNTGMVELLCVAHGMSWPLTICGPNTIARSIHERLCRLCSKSVTSHCPTVVRMAHEELAMLASDAKSYSSNSVMAGLHFLQVHLLPFSCATSVLECLCGQSCAPGPHKAYALAWGCYDQGHMALVPSEVVLDTKDMMVSEVLLLCEKTVRNYANIAHRLCIWTNELRARGRLDAEALHLCAATNEALGRLGGMAESMRGWL